jgi:hypothetical protein
MQKMIGVLGFWDSLRKKNKVNYRENRIEVAIERIGILRNPQKEDNDRGEKA